MAAMIVQDLENLPTKDGDESEHWSDLNTSSASSDFDDDSKWEDINDLHDTGFVHFHAPCMIYNGGVTMVGKTAFVVDAILNRRFIPMPQKYILVIGAITDQEHAEKVESMLRVIKLSQPELKRDDIRVCSSIEEGASSLQKYMKPEQTKLFFVDDAMATKAGVDSIALSSVGTHHQNLILIFCVQNLFVKDSVTIRENAQYIIVWGGFSKTQVECFFRQYPQEAKDRIFSLLSPEGQADADGPAQKTLEDSSLPRIRTPIIIDKNLVGGTSSMKLYNGLFDSHPAKVSFIKHDGGKQHHKFMDAQNKIFKNDSTDEEFGGED